MCQRIDNKLHEDKCCLVSQCFVILSKFYPLIPSHPQTHSLPQQVATRGAALYLMCVATLFAASNTLPLTLDPTTGLQLSSTTTTVGGVSPSASSYFGHTPSQAQQTHQHMPVCVHNAPPDFEQMEIIHRKKVPDRPVEHSSSVAPNQNQRLSCSVLGTNGLDTSHSCGSCLVMGGWNRTVADKAKDLVSDFGTECESKNRNVSEVASPTSTAAMGSMDVRDGMIKKTWTKFEDGLFLLLNLMASIRLSSSTSLPSYGSGNPLPHTPSDPKSPDPKQPCTSGTSRSSPPPPTRTRNNMDSETTGLSIAQLLEHPSCHDCHLTALMNATVHWWDGSADSSLGTFLMHVENTAAVNLTRTLHHHAYNSYLDFSGESGKHNITNSTLHHSDGEAITVDTSTITAMCVCSSRYSESSETVLSSPKLTTGQLAIDLHWQSGGTGDITEHAFIHHYNSTPSDFVTQEDLKFTLTENLLLYANRLLTMAF